MEGEASLARQRARILIADEYDPVREGLRAVLECELEFQVVGEAKNGCEVLRLCRELRPDVVLMDIRMQRVDGLEATRTIKDELPSTAVVIVTLLEPADYFLLAIEAGATAFVLKDAPHHDLVSAIELALPGHGSPKIYRQAVVGSTYVYSNTFGMVNGESGTQSREDGPAALSFVRNKSSYYPGGGDENYLGRQI